MLKFMLRGVLRKIGDFTARVNGFTISPKGVQDMFLRVSRACQKEYLQTLERVRLPLGSTWTRPASGSTARTGGSGYSEPLQCPGGDQSFKRQESARRVLGARINGAA
jgi:hypothetical protein